MHGDVKKCLLYLRDMKVRDRPALKYVLAESKGTHNMRGDVRKWLLHLRDKNVCDRNLAILDH